MLKWFLQFLSDAQVQERYVSAGRLFGDAASFYSSMSVCEEFEILQSEWTKWEAEYARRGYRTIPLMDFIAHGRHGVPLAGLGVKRDAHEKFVLHAQVPQ